ncbi:MAG: hypothetical protein JNN25_07110 [Candidatus Kapabacteria bacterium]|nr:hypothetical protein [Candidatus Kapabacteria bacterium]
MNRVSKFGLTILYCLCTIFAIFLCSTDWAQAQRTWQKIGNLQQERRLFGALAVSDRHIMVMGGYTTSAQITASCEIIDVESRRIITAPRMNAPRAESIFLLTRDSNIVAISGVTSGDNVTPLCELYNRSTMTWSVIGRLITGRRQHVACFLSAEEILVVGGRDGNITTLNSAEIFNIRTGQSRVVANYPFAINYGQSEISSQNKPLVFAGRSGGSNSLRSPNVYEYDILNNRWLLVSSIRSGVAAPALVKLYDARLVIAGGTRDDDPSNYSNMSYLEGYPSFQIAAQMSVERHWLSMAQWNADTVMVLGGFTNSGIVMASTEWIDLKNSRAYSAPSMTEPRCNFTAIGLPQFNTLKQQTKARIVAISGAKINGGSLTPTVEILEETIQQIIPFPSITSVLTETDDCTVFRLRLQASSGAIRAIELGTSANVTLQTLTLLPAGNVEVLVRLINPFAPPSLTSLRITNDALQTEIVPVSVVLPQRRSTTLSVISATEHLFGDSVVTFTCVTLRLRNNASAEVVFPAAYLGRNIEFSAPPAQFPLRIPAGSESAIRLCYAPSAIGLQRDTLTLTENCAVLRVPLAARGAGEMSIGISRCAAPLSLHTIRASSGETVIVADAPFPQPSDGVVHIPVYLATEAPSPAEAPTATLYNGLGTVVGKYSIAEWSVLEKADISSAKTLYSGTVHCSTECLTAGCYRMILRGSDGAMASVALVVAH